MKTENDHIEEWCLIESNPCIFYDMLQKLGATDLSVEDVYDLDYFDDYINNKDEVTINNILSIEEYKNEIEKLENGKEKEETRNCENTLYKDICIETKYDKLLKNSSYLYGVLFLFDAGLAYNDNKYVEHNLPPGLFFAEQKIPNACATQAILSIILNKGIKLHEQIENLKTFSASFDSSMKGLALSNCKFLRDVHNSYKPPMHIYNNDKDEIDVKSDELFHFVSYIQYDKSVYLLDGLQKGPVLLKNEEEEEKKEETQQQQQQQQQQTDWIYIIKKDLKKEINNICACKNDSGGKFNVIAVIKDKELIIRQFIDIHRIVRQRANIKLISFGENIELTDEVNEDNYESLHIPDIENLPDDLNTLYNISQKSTLEINYLEQLLNEQIEIKKMWHMELTFKSFNFYPFITASLDLMAKHNILKEHYQKEKLKKQ